jgi:starvation-inducible DNA-binding protein
MGSQLSISIPEEEIMNSPVMNSQPHTSVPGVDPGDATELSEILHGRLVSTLDLQMTLKHVHWNVVGPGFLSVHEMLDTITEPVRSMSDTLAERIRTLGGVPRGTPGAIVEGREWDDYPLDRAAVYVHLKELDKVFSGIIADHRRAASKAADLDPVTEDILYDQVAVLEQNQWFIRSFFERATEPGSPTEGETSGATAAADRRDADVAGGADRAPTSSEEEAADRAADKVDVESAGSNFRDMAAVGAEVEGEGSID